MRRENLNGHPSSETPLDDFDASLEIFSLTLAFVTGEVCAFCVVDDDNDNDNVAW